MAFDGFKNFVFILLLSSLSLCFCDVFALPTETLRSNLSGGDKGGLLADEIIPLALSAEQGVAVLRSTDGSLRTLRVGDAIYDGGPILKSVLPDRIILGFSDPDHAEQIAWIFKVKNGGERPRIIYFKNFVPDNAQLNSPALQRAQAPSQNAKPGRRD